MNRIVFEKNLYVLNKSVRQTKKDENGKMSEYGVLSLYCIDTDEFEKIFIFEDYTKILARYETFKSYKFKLQCDFYQDKKRLF